MTIPGVSLSARRQLLFVPLIAILGNAFAAVVTFSYFNFIEAGLVRGGTAPHVESDIRFFLAATGLILVTIGLLIALRYRNVYRALERYLSGAETPDFRELIGSLLELPLGITVMSLLGWAMASVIFAFIGPALGILHITQTVHAYEVFVGTLLIGGPTTGLFIFFGLEWQMRKAVQRIFPPHALRDIPDSPRITVLPRMLTVSLFVGVLPVSVVSYVTLKQIHQILEGKQQILLFLEHMPTVIAFLLALAVGTAVLLSLLMSKSVSEPLRIVEAAIGRVSAGDRDTVAAVVTNDETASMAAGFNRMVEALRERDHIRQTFGRYVSEEVASEVLSGPNGVNLGGEVRDISILVSDLRGFTPLTANMEPQRVLQLLNRYVGSMTEVIIDHEGTIDEITGDGILVFFGAPRAIADHPLRAVRCAVAMQAAMERLNRENLALGLPELRMGIGINCGELVVGNIGSERRKKYGAVGSEINVAFRIEGQTRPGEVLISPGVFERVSGFVRTAEPRSAHLKGIDEPLDLYPVIDVSPSVGNERSRSSRKGD